jgi:tRNA dimethylallyltransferase
MKPTLLVIVGATAVGKTAFCIDLAKQLGIPIISADARQFFKEMKIGTAVPSQKELAAVPHYFVQHKSITERYSAADFECDVLQLLPKLFEQKPIACLTGGSGLYIKAVCEGLDEMPIIEPQIRQALILLQERKGLLPLLQQLEQLDNVTYQQIDRNNPQRVIRALEVCLGSGRPFSSFKKQQPVKRFFDIIKIGLERPREELYERINTRVLQMMQDGLLEEAKKLYNYRHLNALQTVGYTELFDYLDGKTSLEQAVMLIQQHTRNYAKRQMTWFKKDKEMNWVHPEDTATPKNLIQQYANI